jgi:hypothetical protein
MPLASISAGPKVPTMATATDALPPVEATVEAVGAIVVAGP